MVSRTSETVGFVSQEIHLYSEVQIMVFPSTDSCFSPGPVLTYSTL